VAQALSGKNGTGIVTDHRGIPVLASWAPLAGNDMPQLGLDFNWAMIGKIDTDEAFQAAVGLGHRVVMLVVGIGLLVAVIAVSQVRKVAKPIAALAEKADLVSSGDMTVEIPQFSRVDEIGILARSFDRMLQSLREQTRNISETVGVLTASASEISSTAVKLAKSTSETSAVVSQSSSTVEQVRLAAKLASEQAQAVSETSRKAATASELGKDATHDTIAQMDAIKKEMDSIADTVKRLRMHSETIGTIVASVQDVAEQSNLLAVNASIEAARAGESGRGFAVVASEIKSLADQSKEATKEIRRILEETSNSIQAVVTATDRGREAVETGVMQSSHVGESIETLAVNVHASAQAAQLIDASSERQVLAVHQMADAMVNIDQAMQESRQAAISLGLSVDQLTGLADSLRQLVTHYRT
jgi:methyl-accepting chemotaxis protein